MGIHKTRPKILPFVNIRNENELPCACVVSFTVWRGEERFMEEEETAKKDREEGGERKQKIGRRENQHEKGRRENVL